MKACNHPSCTDAPCHKKAGFCKFHYDKRWRVGLTAMVDAAPVIAHVEALRELGWVYDEIAQAAGLDRATVATMMRLRRPTSRQASAAGILAIPLVPGNAARLLDPSATRRRLQALSRIGWSQRLVADRTGISLATVRCMFRGSIPSALVDKIARAYEELSRLPGPSRRTSGYAKTAGWLPPSAWVDIEAGVPLCVTPIGARRRVQALIAMGHTYMTIAAACGMGKQAVYTIATGPNGTLMPETMDKILVGFAALSTVPGASRPNIKLARQRNWAREGMWDDIDDPNEVVDCAEDPDDVDEVLVESFIKGRAERWLLSDAEQADAVKQLQEKGLNQEQIAIRMHWNRKPKTSRKVAA